jgi:hypothetical protein
MNKLVNNSVKPNEPASMAALDKFVLVSNLDESR